MRMLCREVVRLNKGLTRLMKSNTSLRHPWQAMTKRNMALEVFDCLKVVIVSNNLGEVVMDTKHTCKLIITDEQYLIYLISLLANKYSRSLEENGILFKHERNGGFCKAVVSTHQPFIIRYSKNLEVVYIHLSYGYWNRQAVPQHSFYR